MPREETQMKMNIILSEFTMCGFPINSKFEVTQKHFCALGTCVLLEEQRFFPKVSFIWKILTKLLENIFSEGFRLLEAE